MEQNEAPGNNTDINSSTPHHAESTNIADPSSSPSSTPQPSTITPPPASSTASTTVPTSTTAAAPKVAPPSTTATTTESVASSTTSSVPVTSSTAPTTMTTATSSNPSPQPPAPAATPTAPAAPTTTASTTTTPSNDATAAAAALAVAPGIDSSFSPCGPMQQCQAEITPMMVPDPMCPTCYSEFVEKIEPDNDPRAFASPAVPAHLAGGSYQSDDGRHTEGGGGGRNHQGPVNLEDLFQLFQAFYAPQRSEAQQRQQPQRQQEINQQQQQDQNQQQQQPHTPGQFLRTGTQYIFTSGPLGMTRMMTTPARGSQQSDGGYTLGGRPTGATPTTEGGTETAGGQHPPPPGPQWHSPPSLISGLLNRLGIEIHYTTDPAALSGGFGGPMSFGGGFLPMVGNPGDYVWGQGGLDDIITQMMELQNRQHGPVGATDEIINAIPHHSLTDEELEAKTECSVCKDEFAREDNLLQLPCKHIFHEDCIKPWLKVSGTCPTCRFSLVGGQDGQHAGDRSDAQGGQDNNGSGNNAPSGGNSNASTEARSSTGGGGFFGFGSVPPSSGSSIPGSFPSNDNVPNVNGGGQTTGAPTLFPFVMSYLRKDVHLNSVDQAKRVEVFDHLVQVDHLKLIFEPIKDVKKPLVLSTRSGANNRAHAQCIIMQGEMEAIMYAFKPYCEALRAVGCPRIASK
ncbi:hypothetical protein BG015_000606 [Linnemannia schmuckeri]|uniref:RING-type domain-containing protein n=1 Tax=Linnemannia schmuckeri TaxID=64567 RepID=A0A9P5VF83_9FUNG|nr:hypothetical protein BG015_000606 [Linnemannia schmuckeri]